MQGWVKELICTSGSWYWNSVWLLFKGISFTWSGFSRNRLAFWVIRGLVVILRLSFTIRWICSLSGSRFCCGGGGSRWRWRAQADCWGCFLIGPKILLWFFAAIIFSQRVAMILKFMVGFTSRKKNCFRSFRILWPCWIAVWLERDRRNCELKADDITIANFFCPSIIPHPSLKDCAKSLIALAAVLTC